MEVRSCRVYARVSTDDLALGVSLGNQVDICRKFAESQSWIVAGEYVDDGYTGGNLKRPAMKRLLSEVRTGEIVLFAKLDRFTRSQRDAINLVEDWKQQNISVKSVTEPFDTSDQLGMMVFGLLASFAQFERARIRERVTSAAQRIVLTQQRRPTGQVPLGYRHTVETGAVIDPVSSPIVRRIFDMFLAGTSLRKLTIALNKEGVPTRRAAFWSAAAVSAILQNPFYTGDVTWGRSVQKGQKPPKGSQYFSNFTTVTGKHEPLISKADFLRVQEIMSARKHMAPRHASDEYVLSGILQCGICGKAMSGHSDRRRNKAQYTCGSASLHGQHKAHYFDCSELENAVAEMLAKMSNPAYIQEALGGLDDTTARMRIETRHQLTAQIDKAKAAIAKWDDAYENGKLTLSAWNEKTENHKQTIAEATDKLAKLDAAPPVRSFPEIASDFANFESVWAAATKAEKKLLVVDLISVIKISPILNDNKHRRERGMFDLQIIPKGIAVPEEVS